MRELLCASCPAMVPSPCLPGGDRQQPADLRHRDSHDDRGYRGVGQAKDAPPVPVCFPDGPVPVLLRKEKRKADGMSRSVRGIH